MGMEEFFTPKQKEAMTFFKAHLDEWAANPIYRLKYVVIFGNEMTGFYDTFEAAFVFAVANYPRDAFIIQQVIRPEEIVNFIYSAVC